MYSADKGRRTSRERATEAGGTDHARDDTPTASLSVSALAASATPPMLMRQALPEPHVHDNSSRGWPATGWAPTRVDRGARPADNGPEAGEASGTDRLSRKVRIFSTLASQVIPALVRAHARQPRVALLRPSTAEVEAVFACLLVDDVKGISRAISQMISRGLSAESVVLDVLMGLAQRLGESWCDDRCDFVAVTVAAGRLQQQLQRLSPVLSDEVGRQRSAQRVLLAQPANEAHMFGLSIASEFFRRDGWDVVGGVAGAVGDPVQRVRSEWFDVVGLSVGSPSLLPWLRDCVAAMRQQSCNPALVILVGGPLFTGRPELLHQVGADLCADAVSAPRSAGRIAAERQQHGGLATRPHPHP